MKHGSINHGSSTFCLITRPYSPHSHPRTEPIYMNREEVPVVYHFEIFEQNLFYKMSTNVMLKYNHLKYFTAKMSNKPNNLFGYWAAKTTSLNKLKDVMTMSLE